MGPTCLTRFPSDLNSKIHFPSIAGTSAVYNSLSPAALSTAPLSPMSPVLSSPHFNDRFRPLDDTSPKSLTPQRKHRKLLKDGSGVEVWPESVEKVFVEGSFLSRSSSFGLFCRSPQVLGIPVCDVVPVSWQKQMAQPILSRLFEERWCRKE